MAKIIITGGQGVVGSSLSFGRRFGRKELDVTRPEQIRAVLLKEKPTIVVHPAAITNVDFCETCSEEAYRVNAWGTYHLAAATRERRAFLVLISTGAVFSGGKAAQITDNQLPVNVYGRTKQIAEMLARDINPQTIIVRTGWLFGGKKDQKFISNILKQIQEGKRVVKAAEDNIGCPTYVKDLAQGLRKLLRSPRPGVYHMVNKGQASRYQIAQMIVRLLKVQVRVKPVKLASFRFAAPRPLKEILIPTKPFLRSWQEALTEYLKTEQYL